MKYYLMHSAKGTTWSKADHKWISRTKKNGKVVYTYSYESHNGKNKGSTTNTLGVDETYRVEDPDYGSDTVAVDTKDNINTAKQLGQKYASKSYEKAHPYGYGHLHKDETIKTFIDMNTGKEISSLRVTAMAYMKRVKNFIADMFV